MSAVVKSETSCSNTETLISNLKITTVSSKFCVHVHELHSQVGKRLWLVGTWSLRNHSSTLRLCSSKASTLEPDLAPPPVAEYSQDWSAPGSAAARPDADTFHVLFHGFGIQVLSHQVCRVIGSCHFLNPNGLLLHLALQPEIPDIQMSQFSEPGTTYNADGGTGVRVHCHSCGDPKVLHQRHHA